MELDYIERAVTLRNQGSVLLLDIEREADILLIDVQCDAIAGTEYTSKKSLPDTGFYGVVTLFGGATVKERIPLQFVYQRVLDWEGDYRRLKCYLTKLESILDNMNEENPDVPPVGDAELPDAFDYRGVPYSKVKIKSLIAAQWTITIRSWIEATAFACQAKNKSEDPTEDEPENPQPQPIPDPNNFPSNLPPPDGPYPGADPGDFNPEDGQPIAGTGIGFYEFRDALSGPFRSNQVSNLSYPGILIPTFAANGNREVTWRDNRGIETGLVEGSAPPVQVRAFRIEDGNGVVLYTPFVDAYSHD